MKILGLILLLSGWLLVLSALVLLPKSIPRAGFIGVAIAVEFLGLALLLRAHLPVHGDRR